MALTKLEVNMFRNLTNIKIKPSSQINLIYGNNGSGKTSLLEAIYLLGMGKSFRGTKNNNLIQNQQDKYTVFAQITDQLGVNHKLGVMSDKNGNTQTNLNGKNIVKKMQVANFLPLQLMNHNSFYLVDGTPKVRRQFIDWGAFHMEPEFLGIWKKNSKLLQQRNAWLKNSVDCNNDIWGYKLEQTSNKLDQYRFVYIVSLKTAFKEVVKQILPNFNLELVYVRGWDFKQDLSKVLKKSYARDKNLGFSSFGPQKADLLIKTNNKNAIDILSRGEQKLVAYALLLAQGYLLSIDKRTQCIYLVDDLAAELDEFHKKNICYLLQDLNCQLFITTTNKQDFNNHLYNCTSLDLFHMKQGNIFH